MEKMIYKNVWRTFEQLEVGDLFMAGGKTFAVRSVTCDTVVSRKQDLYGISEEGNAVFIDGETRKDPRDTYFKVLVTETEYNK